jgi:Ca-activated chloride channel family protein
VISSADHKVQADYAVNMMAMAKDQAIELADKGRKDEAAAVLRLRTAELKTIGDVYSNGTVQSFAAAAAPEAERLQREGMDNAKRKSYRAESQQTKTQQSSAASRP